MNNTPSSPSRRGWLYRLWQGFWLVTLVVSLGYAWYSFYVPSNDVAWAKDYATAQQQAAQSDKPMLLFFTATWCVPCRIMKRTVWADEQVAAEVNAQFIPMTLYVDDPDAAAAFNRYRVGATPTTIITDPEGNALQQIQGKIDKPQFLEWLDEKKKP